MAQEKVVSGTVVDQNDEALPGVSVIIIGTSVGTVTNTDGYYSLNVEPADTLYFLFIGFQEETALVGDRSIIDVRLNESVTNLDEVVVVGYGTQKKVNLTGAVDEVSSKAIENRPITNVAQALQGKVANLNITFGDGTPGGGANYNIRGTTSINGGGSLILIDGVAGDPRLINTNDIQSVSVLKDAASAAIYGARGAFGVILITTKTGGKKKTTINYSNNFSVSTPTIIPEAVTDTYTSMKMVHDAYNAYDGSNYFTPEQLGYAQQRSEDPSLPAVRTVETSSGEEYEYYGNTDWFNEMYEEYTPMMQQNLSIAGGKDNISYYLSGGYLSQNGVFKYDADKFERINFRAKIDAKVNNWLSFNNNLMYNKGISDFPAFWGHNSVDIWRYVAVLGQGHQVPKNPNGSWTFAGFPLAFLQEGGRSLKKENLLQNTIGMKMSFLDDDWRVYGNYTYQNDGLSQNNLYKRLSYSRSPDVFSEIGDDRVEDVTTDNYYQVINLYTEYEKNLGKHYVKGLVGYNQELRRYNMVRVSRFDLLSELSSLALATGDTRTDANSYEWALRGVFFRMNYSFDDKYLVEVNGRYDGTSRFPTEDRFGFFPSFSAAWRISEENFFQGVKPVINELKLRGSYGTLGNQSLTNNYPYIASMSSYISPVIINGEHPIAIGDPGLVSPNLTWEKATTLDFGVDMGLLENRLNLTFDWYTRETKDMLTKGKTLPSVLGTAEPEENAADLVTEGWELSLNWDNSTELLGKPFAYNLGVLLSDYRTQITRYDNPNNFLGDYYEGQQFGEIWGFKTAGFFGSDAEVEQHADQTEVVRWVDRQHAGDLKFTDLNGDGKVTYGENTVDDPGDRVIIGNSTPRYSFGFNGGFNWGNLSLSLFVQGVGKRDYYPGPEEAYLWSVYNRPYNTPLKHLVDNTWTPENPDAYFPRLKGYIALAGNRGLSAPQTRYLQDASYIRLKNLTIGYNLPQNLLGRIGIDQFRIYVSGENLLESTGLVMPVDPEALYQSHGFGDGQTYPFARTYSVGLNISF